MLGCIGAKTLTGKENGNTSAVPLPEYSMGRAELNLISGFEFHPWGGGDEKCYDAPPGISALGPDSGLSCIFYKYVSYTYSFQP